MTRNARIIMILGLLAGLVMSGVLFATLYLPSRVHAAHREECHNRGGRYVQSRAESGICVKNGLVIVIWNLSGQVDQP